MPNVTHDRFWFEEAAAIDDAWRVFRPSSPPPGGALWSTTEPSRSTRMPTVNALEVQGALDDALLRALLNEPLGDPAFQEQVWRYTISNGTIANGTIGPRPFAAPLTPEERLRARSLLDPVENT